MIRHHQLDFSFIFLRHAVSEVAASASSVSCTPALSSSIFARRLSPSVQQSFVLISLNSASTAARIPLENMSSSNSAPMTAIIQSLGTYSALCPLLASELYQPSAYGCHAGLGGGAGTPTAAALTCVSPISVCLPEWPSRAARALGTAAIVILS